MLGILFDDDGELWLMLVMVVYDGNGGLTRCWLRCVFSW